MSNTLIEHIPVMDPITGEYETRTFVSKPNSKRGVMRGYYKVYPSAFTTKSIKYFGALIEAMKKCRSNELQWTAIVYALECMGYKSAQIKRIKLTFLAENIISMVNRYTVLVNPYAILRNGDYFAIQLTSQQHWDSEVGDTRVGIE